MPPNVNVILAAVPPVVNVKPLTVPDPVTLETPPPPLLTVVKVNAPLPSVVNTCPLAPSAPTSSNSSNPKETAPVKPFTLSTSLTSAPVSIPASFVASAVGYEFFAVLSVIAVA